jgi:periplasmic divalent cation tolerance protein
MSSYTVVYVTAANRDQALAIGRALVEARLAACTNILPGVTSIYRWEGAVQQDDEVALLAKTRSGLVDALVAKVLELHTYSCPCVVALPIVAGNPAFLEWIGAETAGGR